MIKGILFMILFIVMALLVGKIISKLKLPAILGWLLTGMLIGPHVLNWMSSDIMDAGWFHVVCSIGEVTAGMLIGSELIFRQIKKSGKQIVTITLFEGITTFVLVTLAFFLIADIPFSIALIFGGIALATAPAPSLSIVKEYKAKGPVSKILIPLAALDDILAVVIFFLIIGFISSSLTGEGVRIIPILMMVIAPIGIGAVTGFVSSKFLKKDCEKWETILKTVMFIILTAAIGKYVNEHYVSVNLFLVGIAFSTVIANSVEEKRLHRIMGDMEKIIGVALILLILTLGAPLDIKLIFGAGALTAVYIIVRACGKILGAFIGGKVSKADKNVSKYLGLALLPHSGVSLIFTGIAVTTLMPFEPEYALIIQGTIAAAAVINEIIAVFLAKQAFKMAGEIGAEEESSVEDRNKEENIILKSE
ncbi:MAG: cation:proton antiporter [Clostridium sp.]